MIRYCLPCYKLLGNSKYMMLMICNECYRKDSDGKLDNESINRLLRTYRQ